MATSTRCTWCRSRYQIALSHARDQNTFCSKKCELEARFWLFRLFHPVDDPKPIGDGKARALPEGKAPEEQ